MPRTCPCDRCVLVRRDYPICYLLSTIGSHCLGAYRQARLLMNDPDERIRRMRELRDAKAIPHLQQYAPVWLVSETPLLKDDALQFNVVFYHPYYGWVSRRYRFDAFNNVLYHQGQTALSEDEALLNLAEKTPLISAETINTVDSYGG